MRTTRKNAHPPYIQPKNKKLKNKTLNKQFAAQRRGLLAGHQHRRPRPPAGHRVRGGSSFFFMRSSFVVYLIVRASKRRAPPQHSA